MAENVKLGPIKFPPAEDRSSPIYWFKVFKATWQTTVGKKNVTSQAEAEATINRYKTDIEAAKQSGKASQEHLRTAEASLEKATADLAKAKAQVSRQKTFRQSGEARLNVSEKVKFFEIKDGPSSKKKIMDTLELHIHDIDFSEYDDPIWSHGNIIQCAWGYPGNMARPRYYMIKGVDIQKDELRITGQGGVALAKSGKPIGVPFMDAIAKRRTFKDKTISDIVRQIAIENEFDESLLQIQETKKRYPYKNQPGVSDARFVKQLRDLLVDWVFYVDSGGVFHFHEPDYQQAPTRTLVWFTDQIRGDIFSIGFEQNHQTRSGKVSGAGFDSMKKGGVAKGKGKVEHEGSNDKTPRDGTASTTQVSKFVGNSATGQVADMVRETTKAMGAKGSEAKAAGMYRSGARGNTILKITIVGDPTIEAKQMIELRGVGAKLSGKYYAKYVTHKIDSGGGYGTVLECLRDGHGGEGAKSDAKQNTKEQTEDGALKESIVGNTATGQVGFRQESQDNPPTRLPGSKENTRVRYSTTGSGGPHRTVSGEQRISSGRSR